MMDKLLRKTSKDEKQLLGIKDKEEKEGKLVSALMKMNKNKNLPRQDP